MRMPMQFLLSSFASLNHSYLNMFHVKSIVEVSHTAVSDVIYSF